VASLLLSTPRPHRLPSYGVAGDEVKPLLASCTMLSPPFVDVPSLREADMLRVR